MTGDAAIFVFVYMLAIVPFTANSQETVLIDAPGDERVYWKEPCTWSYKTWVGVWAPVITCRVTPDEPLISEP